MNTQEELYLLLRAAQLYYEDGLTQQEVATRLGISRPSVSRLLAQARQEGIVQITVTDPFATCRELEARLSRAFSLRQAVVVTAEGASGERLGRRLGLAAARYLRSTLSNSERVGIGWGRTLHAVIEAFNDEPKIGIQVLPMIGGLGQISPSFQVNELARRLAEAFAGTWRPLYAPAFIADPAACRSLCQVPDVAEIIKTWPTLGMAVVGIGHFAMHRQSSMLFAEYMGETWLKRLEQRGAVGDLCGRFFDVQGNQCLLEPGVIGISLEQLRALDQVIGVAGGEDKAAAILGALRGGYLNVLVTDTMAAQVVLAAQEIDG